MSNKKPVIKNNLLKYRVWKNLTQKELAAKLKISKSQLRLIEVDQIYPKYQLRSRLCNFFNISQDQMFYYSQEESKIC